MLGLPTCTVVAQIQSRSDLSTIRISQIRDGKWLADAGFSRTNLGNLDRIRTSQIRDGKWLADAGFSGTNLGNLDRMRETRSGFPKFVTKKAPQLAKQLCLPRRGLEGEPHHDGLGY